jgi:RNA recognition motif-containing protein
MTQACVASVRELPGGWSPSRGTVGSNFEASSNEREKQASQGASKKPLRVAMGSRLYVGNLAFSTTQATLESAFATAGEVREVAMPTDRETGQPRGFAFVTMSSEQAAINAISKLNGTMLDGRPIKVNEAQERPPRGGGGGGYGGGGGGGGRGGGGGGRGGGGRDRY